MHVCINDKVLVSEMILTNIAVIETDNNGFYKMLQKFVNIVGQKLLLFTYTFVQSTNSVNISREKQKLDVVIVLY